MKKVEMSVELARQLLRSADEATKKELLEACPELNQSIVDRIKSVDCAVQALGDNDPDVITYKALLNSGISGHTLNYQRLVVIAKALNEGWTPDWSNGSEGKFYPWFNLNPSDGSGFSFHAYVCNYRLSLVGSHLCYRSPELAKYAGKQFLGIYKEFMLIK